MSRYADELSAFHSESNNIEEYRSETWLKTLQVPEDLQDRTLLDHWFAVKEPPVPGRKDGKDPMA